MKKIDRLIIAAINIAAVALLFFRMESESVARGLSDSLFFVGLGNLLIGLMTILLNHNYFNGLFYGLYYVYKTFEIDKYEKANAGTPHEKKTIKTFNEYVTRGAKRRQSKEYFVCAAIMIALSAVLAAAAM